MISFNLYDFVYCSFLTTLFHTLNYGTLMKYALIIMLIVNKEVHRMDLPACRILDTTLHGWSRRKHRVCINLIGHIFKYILFLLKMLQLTFIFSPQLYVQITISLSFYLHTITFINWSILADGEGV